MPFRPVNPAANDRRPSQHNLAALYEALTEKYIQVNTWLRENRLYQQKQGTKESVQTYAAAMRQQMAQLRKSPDETLALFMNGLWNPIKQQVILHDPKGLDNVEYAAKLCEPIMTISHGSLTVAAIDPVTEKLQALQQQIKDQGEKLQAISINRLAEKHSANAAHDKRLYKPPG